ncbi:flocculation protein FLO11-like [Camellia sinensis]|uniref:flocculation protein FLO11-like n=1 Tax=Camellia sinensis TaxID=4442 RepID=UPI00103583E1|nr:flocculation protein FLO11-like [Camellia sinensis]
MAHKRTSDASPSAPRLSKRLREDPAVVDVLGTVATGHAASPRPDSDLDDTLPLSARLVKMCTPRIAVIDDDDDEAESSDHFCDLIPRTRRHRPTVAEEEHYLGDEFIGAHRSDVEIAGGTDATEIDVAGHASRSDVEMRCASGNGVEVDVLEISETRSGTYGDSHPPALLPSSGMTATVQASSDIEIDQVVSTRPSDFVDARSPSVAPALHIDSPSVLAANGVLPSPTPDSAPVLAATGVLPSPASDSAPVLAATGVLPSPASDSAPVSAATGVLPSPALGSTPTLFVTPHGSPSQGGTPAFETTARGSSSPVPSNILDLNLSDFHINSDAFGLSPYRSTFSGSGPLPGVTPPGGSSNPIDIGEIPETSSFPAPIPPSASGKVSFLHYWVAPEFASVLQLVHSSYPETFASFAC